MTQYQGRSRYSRNGNHQHDCGCHRDQTRSSGCGRLWPDHPLNFSLEAKRIWMTILHILCFRQCLASLLDLTNPSHYLKIFQNCSHKQWCLSPWSPQCRTRANLPGEVGYTPINISLKDRLWIYQTLVLPHSHDVSPLLKFIQAVQRSHLLARKLFLKPFLSVSGSAVSSLLGSSHLILPTNTWGEDYYYLSFTVEGTWARGVVQVIPGSWQRVKLEFEPKFVGL